MKKIRALAMLFAMLICFSTFAVSANALLCNPADSATIQKKIKSHTYRSENVVVEYDVYTSPSYDPTDDSKSSTIVLCFAESGERFSRIFSLLLSADADAGYSDYVYTAVNLRLPEGQKWVDTDEESGYFDAKAASTAAMTAVPTIVADIMAYGFPAQKTVVCGVGVGGTAAWYYACHNTKQVSHILSVGACLDPESIIGLRDANINALAYIGKLDKSRYQAHQELSANATNLSYNSITIKESSLSYDRNTERVFTAEDDPSITDWLVKNSYQTQFFQITSNSNGKGGTITSSQQVFYGNSAVFYIKPDDNYFIKDLSINGQSAPLTKLVPEANGKVSYTFANVTAAGSIYVTFAHSGAGSFSGDSLMTLCTILAVAFVVAAVALYAINFFVRSKKA